MRALIAAAFVSCSGAPPVEPVEKPAAPDRFHELLVTREACHAPPAATVSRAAALADVAVIERIIQRGYVRYQAQELGELRRAVAALPEPIASTTLRRTIADYAGLDDAAIAIGAVGLDGRLELSPLAPHDDAYASDVVTGAITGCDSHRGPNGALAIAYAPRADCRLDGAPLAMHRLRSAPDLERATFERTEHPVPTLRLRDLDEANRDALDVFVEAAGVVRAAPVAILDLRGTHGDQLTIALQFFGALLGHALEPPALDVLHSEVTLQGQVNATTCTLARSDVDRDARLAIEDRRRMLSQAIDDAALKAPIHTHEVPPIAAGPKRIDVYQGTLIVVTDASCSGTCELMVALARQLPHAVIAGENTAGAAAGELLPYRLPNSGLWLQILGSVVTPAPPVHRGYLPDLWLDADRLDPVALARCATDAACR